MLSSVLGKTHRALVFACFFLIWCSRGEAQDVIWSNNYGGTYNEQGYSGYKLTDGGYVILGATYSFGHGDHDIYLLRLDSLGHILWTESYGGSAADYGYDIQQTSDNGFIIVGLTQSYGSGEGDVYLIKVDATGTVLWTRTYGGVARDEGWSVRQTADGGYILAGTTNSFGAGYGDVYLIKTNSSGTAQWSRTYGGAGGESGSAVRPTPDGGYVTVGSTGSFGDGYSCVYVVKTDGAGDSVWATTYGGFRADFGYSVEIAPDGGFVFVGASSSFGHGYTDVYLVKTDPDGFVEWEQFYGGSMDDRGYAVQPAGDGGYILAGTTESFGSGKIDCYAIRTNPLGEPIWTNTYGGAESDFCRSVVIEEDAFCLIGYSFTYTSGGSDVYILKAQGEQMTPVEEPDDHTLPADFNLAQNYPNPFNPATTIEFSLPRRSPVRLTIYNILGQRVREWFFESAPPGTSSISWNSRDDYGNTVASGVYLYRLETENTSQTKKMILLK